MGPHGTTRLYCQGQIGRTTLACMRACICGRGGGGGGGCMVAQWEWGMQTTIFQSLYERADVGLWEPELNTSIDSALRVLVIQRHTHDYKFRSNKM